MAMLLSDEFIDLSASQDPQRDPVNIAMLSYP